MSRDPQYATGVEKQPVLDRLLQSNRKGLHVIGAAKASPLLKTCINEGYEVVRSISRVMPPDGAALPDRKYCMDGFGRPTKHCLFMRYFLITRSAWSAWALAPAKSSSHILPTVTFQRPCACCTAARPGSKAMQSSFI